MASDNHNFPFSFMNFKFSAGLFSKLLLYNYTLKSNYKKHIIYVKQQKLPSIRDEKGVGHVEGIGNVSLFTATP